MSHLFQAAFRSVLFAFFLFTLAPVNGQVVWDRDFMDEIRDGKHTAGSPVGKAIRRLRVQAEQAMKHSPYSVTQNDGVPPSGDLHDYQSFSRYWWPDPNKPDGLPYIRKDGVSNRKLIAKGDRNILGHFCRDATTLGLAGYFLKEPAYTKHAARMVRAWFLDEATRMKPNLNFGQGVPGRESGRKSGIIDTRDFMQVLDAVELFDEANWSVEDHRKLQKWFDEYQTWLAESSLGKGEQKATNNHGSWYAAQRAHYALFAGKEEVAREIVRQTKKRIAEQFDSAGNQADEIERTRSLFYSVFNITALSRVARVGDRVGEDLWEFKPQHGCGIKKGLKVLLPHITGESKWPHQQLESYELTRESSLTLRLFLRQFNDDSFLAVANKVKNRNADSDFSDLVVGVRQEAMLTK